MNIELNNKMTGWFKAKILATNPDKEKLLEITGETELDKDPSYTFTNKSGNRVAIIDVYMSDVSEDNVFKYTIYLEDKERESKNGNVNLFVNQLGDTQWSNSTENLWDDFKNFITKTWNDDIKKYEVVSVDEAKDYHVAKIGEAELMHLLRATTNEELKSSSTNLFLNLEELFEGDFSQLDVIQTDIPLFCAFTYVNNKYEQKVFSEFVPLNMYNDMVTSTSNKYIKRVYDNWHKSFDFIKDEVFYNIGRLQPFKEEHLKNVKEINDYDSEY